jgi:hypothetical protein
MKNFLKGRRITRFFGNFQVENVDLLYYNITFESLIKQHFNAIFLKNIRHE